MLEPAAAAVQKRTAHARQRQQQKPTHKKPPEGTGNVPIHNQRQANALTEIITVIRCTKHRTNTPDWHEKAIMNVLRDNHNHPAPYPTIVQALTKYATTSDKRTPAFLFDPLRDWKEPGDHTPRDPCEDHPTHSAHSCPSCRADVLAGIRPKEFIGKAYDIPITGID